jgi:egghead protein (zeste-white 4 protein)
MINKTPTPCVMSEQIDYSDRERAEKVVSALKKNDPYTHVEASKQEASTFFFRLRKWMYRGWLCVVTAVLITLLLKLQATLDGSSSYQSFWQESVQWAELSWLVPVPIAISLWLGWLIFAEAVKRKPQPINVPLVGEKRVRLVFRFVTRGDNVDVLCDSVQAVHRACRSYPRALGPYRVEVVAERPISIAVENDADAERTRTYVVPKAYVTAHASRFKARALTYVQEQVRPEEEDWYIYLDEESLIDGNVIAGIYGFISKTLHTEAQTRMAGKKPTAEGVIGQGAILYQGGNWFFRGADALRTADDLGRFRLQYALGMPLFGVHGSYLVVRGNDDRRLSFDVGHANSITEDTAWALRAWSKGFRFAWVEGYLREQPPQRLMDLVKQRSRWLAGIRLVLCDQQIPLRQRWCLGVFTVLWQLAPLPFLVATLALFIHTSPFVWMRLPADFAWATFVLAYLQGLDVLIQNEPSADLQGTWRQRLQFMMRRVLCWAVVLCTVWYSLLEAAATLYSLKPKQGFFVIQKPSLLPAQQEVYYEETAVPVGATKGGRS